MIDKYAVIGNPIEHSKSPQIHAAFAAQTGEDIEYGRILGDMEDFAGDVRHFVRSGGKGLNVTVPFKEHAWQLVDENSERAANALARRFQPVFVDEPTVEDTISILRGLKEKYELHHGVRITDSALVAAATLSNRYITDRFLPDKAIDLVDEAASRIRIEIDSKPEEMDRLERRIIQLKIERGGKVRDINVVLEN